MDGYEWHWVRGCPALFGREISEQERELISIQVKEGGLGIRQFYLNSTANHNASKAITSPLVNKIIEQSNTLPDEEEVKIARSTTMSKIREQQDKTTTAIKAKQSPELQRKLIQVSEPGASSWLGALPLSQYGFDLSKGEFHDALCMRYNMQLKNLPTKCACNQKFTITHALDCHKGGFINARHDNVRDLEAHMMKSVCNDVEIEPTLQTVTNVTNFARSANVSDEG